MPYIISNSDGSLTVTVADSVIDTTTYSLALVGRNVSNFGQYFAQNTIRHLENFASATAPSPSTRLIGQLWFDKSEEILKIWDGNIWKRSTGILVGAENERPTNNLIGGGTAFFNTSSNKLEVHNGTTFVEASYPGEVTSRYSNSTVDNNPTHYGTRVRNIFLKDTTGISNPVLAICYVKSTSEGSSDTVLPNRGSTLIDGQYETVMALFSDRRFTIDTSAAAIVDGTTVTDLALELVGPGGIANARAGRAEGVILPGLNVREEFETAGVLSVANLFAENIGTDGSIINPVGRINVNELTVNTELTVGNASVTLGGDLDVADDVTIGGDISATTGIARFANLEVSANTILNGETTINGQLIVNGVNTQTIGQASQVIENYYGDQITTANISVSKSANISAATIGTLAVTNNQTIGGTLTVSGATTLAGTTVTTLKATSAVDFDSTLNVDGESSFNDDVTVNSANVTADYFVGAATQAVITENNSENASMYVLFSDGQTGKQELEADTTLRYNPNSGVMSLSGISATGTVSADTVSATTATLGTVTVGSLTDGTATLTGGDLSGLGTVTATTFDGTATSAQYADLAEIYVTDQDYEPGTVVKIGGSAEITQTTTAMDTEVFGVISTDPAYLMNSKEQGAPVAMTGRVPVKIVGKIQKGERLVSSDLPGYAMGLGDMPYDARAVIGRSLVTKESDGESVIEAVIGVK